MAVLFHTLLCPIRPCSARNCPPSRQDCPSPQQASQLSEPRTSQRHHQPPRERDGHFTSNHSWQNFYLYHQPLMFFVFVFVCHADFHILPEHHITLTHRRACNRDARYLQDKLRRHAFRFNFPVADSTVSTSICHYHNLSSAPIG